MSQVRKLSRSLAKKARSQVRRQSVLPHASAHPSDAPRTAALRAAGVTDRGLAAEGPLPNYVGIWKELRTGLETVLRMTVSYNIPILNKYIMAALSLISRSKICSNAHGLGKKGKKYIGGGSKWCRGVHPVPRHCQTAGTADAPGLPGRATGLWQGS